MELKVRTCAAGYFAIVLVAMMSLVSGSMARPSTSPGDAFRRGDYAKTISLLKPQAQSGVISAQIMLGQMYLNGQGVAADQEQGLFWIRKAADQGSAIAAYDLGVLSMNDADTNKDPRIAARWFRKAAHQHYPDAAFNLSVLYQTGTGVEKNDVLALSWVEAAMNYLPATAGSDIKNRFDGQRMKISAGMSPEQVKAAANLVSAYGPLPLINVKNREALEKLGVKSYPLNLRNLARGGTAVVLVFVRADGSVGDTVVENSTGYPEIDDVTVKLLKSAEIEPRLIDGRPVDSWQLMKWSWRVNEEPWYSFHNLNKMPN